ncbi:MAG: hypothetical protein M3443_03195 [Actinomycetota bacterium]|nr:hypothetical protein [Actinomycetota bacterium]
MNVPRGFWHRASRAERGDGFSLHATFGITKRTGVHWLTWLADNARRGEAFRRDLDRDRRSDQAKELIAAAAALLGKNSPGAFLRSRETEHGAARHVPALDILGHQEAVVCVTAFKPTIEKTVTGAIEVSVAGRKLTFAAAAQPALDALLSGHPVKIADLASATGLDVAQLVDVFLKERICAPLTPELSSGYTDLVTELTFSTPLTS